MFAKSVARSSVPRFVIFSAKAYHLPMTTPWTQIQHILQERLSPGHYKVWIAPLTAETGGESSEVYLKLFAPTEFMAQRIKVRYLETIAQAAADVLGQRPALSVAACLPAAPGHHKLKRLQIRRSPCHLPRLHQQLQRHGF